MERPDEIKPDYWCPVCDSYPMRPSHHDGEYFYYVCKEECTGKRGFLMTRFNKFKDVMRPKERPV